MSKRSIVHALCLGQCKNKKRQSDFPEVTNESSLGILSCRFSPNSLLATENIVCFQQTHFVNKFIF